MVNVLALDTTMGACSAAIVQDDKITGFKIVDAGSGYSSAPDAVVVGHRSVRVKAEIEFTNDLRTNGHLKSLTVVKNSER